MGKKSDLLADGMAIGMGLVASTLLTAVVYMGTFGAYFNRKILEGNVEKELRDGPNYTLLIKESETGKSYGINIRDYSEKPLSALEALIEPNDQVRITFCNDFFDQAYLGKDGVGTAPTRAVTVVKKQ
ncbi:hypothetical protein J4423_05350 [Candidatus Pacearchaeota archaeon]|nr:hypothetical protein [Candidatus Pacearchaeota archaeon]